MTGSTASTRDTGEFNDKRVLVTGGTKGAGKAIADRFLLAGGTVIITARSAPEEKTGAHFIQADVSASEGTTKVRHPPQSGWLDGLGRLKGGRWLYLGVARCAPLFTVQN
jgi:NAD(P)-dependent dehydrogenase (short-subunit alcohol dehydrogenase family)